MQLLGASQRGDAKPRANVQLALRCHLSLLKPDPVHLSTPTNSFTHLRNPASTMQSLFGGKSPQEALAEDAAHAVEAITKLTSSGSELKGMPKR